MSAPIDGTCATTDPELWWPVAGEIIGPKAAKRFCTACPVRVACGQEARGEQFGIWAGFNMGSKKGRDALQRWLADQPEAVASC